MKKINWLWAACLAACIMTACGGDSSEEPGPQPGEETATVVGTWHMVSWDFLQAADIYVSFEPTGTFELYQRLTKPSYEHFRGTYSYVGGTLSGVYSDAVPWGNSYKVAFSADGAQMTLTGVAGTDDVATFARASIPEDILSGELEAQALSRSEEEGARFL